MYAKCLPNYLSEVDEDKPWMLEEDIISIRETPLSRVSCSYWGDLDRERR